jgi:hypothetical protein
LAYLIFTDRGFLPLICPDWLRDLNFVFSDDETSSVDSPELSFYWTLRVEQSRRAATLVPTTKKPFDALAEGPVSKNSRDGWTPLELFLSGVRKIISKPQARIALLNLCPIPAPHT